MKLVIEKISMIMLIVIFLAVGGLAGYSMNELLSLEEEIKTSSEEMEFQKFSSFWEENNQQIISLAEERNKESFFSKLKFWGGEDEKDTPKEEEDGFSISSLKFLKFWGND